MVQPQIVRQPQSQIELQWCTAAELVGCQSDSLGQKCLLSEFHAPSVLDAGGLPPQTSRSSAAQKQSAPLRPAKHSQLVLGHLRQSLPVLVQRRYLQQLLLFLLGHWLKRRSVCQRFRKCGLLLATLVLAQAGVIRVWGRVDDGRKRNCQGKMALSWFVSRAQFLRGQRRKANWEQAGQTSGSVACVFHKDFQ